jgi:bacillithiol biosynthesis deacetylase BshB1
MPLENNIGKAVDRQSKFCKTRKFPCFPTFIHCPTLSKLWGISMSLDYLIIASHPDDAELCLGGTLLSLKSHGATVGVLDLTSGEPTPHGSPEIRQKECEAATKLLQLDWRGQLDLTNRSLEADLESRWKLAARLRELKPRILLTHYWEDAHPDHVSASALTDAARFWAKLSKTDLPGEPFSPHKILYYYSFHLRLACQPSFVVDTSPFFEKKLEILSCYHSQFIQGRPTAFPSLLDDIRARDRYWGWSIGAGYGEPLRTREMIGLENLACLR